MKVIVIDYSNGYKDHVLMEVLDEYGAIVDDWAERDYGLLVFVEVDADKASDLKRRINELKDFKVDTADYIS